MFLIMQGVVISLKMPSDNLVLPTSIFVHEVFMYISRGFSLK